MSLKNELSEFLHALDVPKIFYTALPDDVRKFLVFQERKGRTQIHTDTCEFKGHVGEKSCDCPTTLAAKSVDSLVGKIRAIFRDIGRSGDWNPVFLTKNPAASHVIKRHLQSVTLERSVQGVAKKTSCSAIVRKVRYSVPLLNIQNIKGERRCLKVHSLQRQGIFCSSELFRGSGWRFGDAFKRQAF